MKSVLWSGILILAGCSAQGRDGHGTVQGSITFQNKPLSGGSIHFFLDQERVGSFMIRPDGAYSAEVPVGRVKVAIETVSAKYQDRGANIKIMKEHGYDMSGNQKFDNPAFKAGKMIYVDIPERFSDPEKSGLECEVTPGNQTRNFDLK